MSDKTPSPDPRWSRLFSWLSPSGTHSVHGKLILTPESQRTDTAAHSLLRKRLRAVSLLLLLARLAFVLREVLAQSSTVSPRDVIMLGGLLGLFLSLQSLRVVTPGRLRIVEFLIVIGVTVDISLTLNERLAEVVSHMQRGSGTQAAQLVEMVAAIKDQIIATIGLMLVYGMFIPNSGRRSAGMVLMMAVIPGIVVFGNKESRDGLNTFRRENTDVVRQLRSVNLMSLAIGAGCAIYGTVVINQLRRRVQSAEELGQYQLREKIGSGGMGDVFLAEHKLLRRLCAVKLIRGDQAADPVMLTRFEREVRATASLTHWNTIQIFDYGQTEDGRFFYVMEYLKGKNLLECVRQFGPMSADRTVFILEQVCEALRESGSRGLVHRDIKPSNIFLANLGDRFDVVKLLDFGLVRPVTGSADADVSGVNQINGSPRYMCPEQAQGEMPDIRGDIYSLGAVAYFLLSGRPPFELENPLQLVIAHATRTPPTFEEIQVSVPGELSRVVLRCLNKQPADRFADPEEILQALAELPEHGRWNWRTAEDWWRSHDTASARHPGIAPRDVPAVDGSTGSSGADQTDPTVIDIRANRSSGK